MRIVILFLLVYLFVITLGCRHQENGTGDTAASNRLLGKTILFPNNLSILDGNQLKTFDPSILETRDKKMISIVDGNCMKCIIGQLNLTDSTFNAILPKENGILIFILNVSKQDSSYFMLNLQPAIEATGLLLWDNNYNFERQNNLFTSDPNLRMFMTDGEDKIVHYGNPIISPESLYGYKEKMKQ